MKMKNQFTELECVITYENTGWYISLTKNKIAQSKNIINLGPHETPADAADEYIRAFDIKQQDHGSGVLVECI